MLKGDTPAQNRINKQEFEKLCGMWATKNDIAGFFDVSEDTVETWCKKNYDGDTFSVVYKKKSAKGNVSLRQAQLKSALNGNVTMQVWLGKQHLGQKEYAENNNTEEQRIVIVNDLPKDDE